MGYSSKDCPYAILCLNAPENFQNLCWFIDIMNMTKPIRQIRAKGLDNVSHLLSAADEAFFTKESQAHFALSTIKRNISYGIEILFILLTITHVVVYIDDM